MHWHLDMIELALHKWSDIQYRKGDTKQDRKEKKKISESNVFI